MQLGAVHGQSATSTALDRPKDLTQAAEAFEAMFLAMLLKTARQASQSEGSKDSDGTTDTVMEMAEEHLAAQIAKGKGVGFAATMIKRIRPPNLEVVSAGSFSAAASGDSQALRE